MRTQCTLSVPFILVIFSSFFCLRIWYAPVFSLRYLLPLFHYLKSDCRHCIAFIVYYYIILFRSGHGKRNSTSRQFFFIRFRCVWVGVCEKRLDFLFSFASRRNDNKGKQKKSKKLPTTKWSDWNAADRQAEIVCSHVRSQVKLQTLFTFHVRCSVSSGSGVGGECCAVTQFKYLNVWKRWHRKKYLCARRIHSTLLIKRGIGSLFIVVCGISLSAAMLPFAGK